MRRLTKVCLIIMVSFLSVSAQQNGIYNVVDFGAIADGETVNTISIQKAIDKCTADGGGKVFFPNGEFVTGTIILKDNVTLTLSAGATILASLNLDDYPHLLGDLKSYNDLFFTQSLIFAHKQTNIGVEGKGTINGRGENFIRKTKKKPERYRKRPFVIKFIECKYVTVEGVTLRNSASWMQQYLGCEYVRVSKINVYNHSNKNNDMIDIDGCKNFIMSDCFGDSDDDAITIKSTSARASENITITNCVVSSHCNAIKFGTESIGGFKNITISNIVVKPSADRDPIYGYKDGIGGIIMGMVDGGTLDGVTISNIRIDGPKVPLYMRLGNRARTVRADMEKPPVGSFRNVNIDNVIATNASSIGCSITGLKYKKIENVNISNVTIEFAGGGTEEDSKKEIEELEDHYPESTMFGNLPSYGFFIRHVDNISMSGIKLSYKEDDLRPVFYLDDVSNSQFEQISFENNKNSISPFVINSSSNIYLNSIYPKTEIKNSIKLIEKNSKIFFNGSAVIN